MGDSNSIEYMVKIMSAMVFIVSYSYLLYNLLIIIKKKSISNALSKTADSDEKKNKATEYDLLIDLLYNLFQPVGILFISVILYYSIIMTTSNQYN